MALFKKTTMQAAFLKMGIYGDPGTGKTYTASQIAKGLSLMTGKRPVMFLDTETGATWVHSIFDAAGIEFFSEATRSFTDLKAAVDEAEAAQAILIVDSMTHFWEEIRETYLAAKRKRLRNEHARLELPDWNIIKPEWGRFTSRFLNSKCHIILCGRAGSVYEFQENEETNKREMITTGTRMAAEKGMGYEPSILVEMTQRQIIGARKKKTIVHTATVLKDRSTNLDGKQFDNPTFESFLPHVKCLNLGGQHAGFDEDRTSEGLFPEAGNGRDTSAVRRRIVIDEVEALLLEHGLAGSSADAKLARSRAIKEHFGTVSKTEIEELMPLEQLKLGLLSLRTALEGDKSAAHTSETVSTLKQQLVDSLKAEETNEHDAAVASIEAAIKKCRSLRTLAEVWDKYMPTLEELDPVRLSKVQAAKAQKMAALAPKVVAAT